MDHTLRNISNMMIQRYSDRYRKLGYDIKTLGWGSEQQQNYRFTQTLELGLNLSEKTILDIGCGFGDYASFLLNNNITFSSYLGVDINADLINESNLRHKTTTNCDFQILNIVEESSVEPIADIAIMLGLLNLNLKGDMDNYEYSFRIIENAFSLVREGLIVDFISIKRDAKYPEEDFIFYHDPVRVMEFAFGLTDNVLIKHDYVAIPQKEFMMVFKK